MDGSTEVNLRIILVEDDEVDRMAVRRALRRLDIQIHIEEAATCREAMVILRNSTFDCALVDYQLADGDALDLLQELRKEHDSTPIVVLTGLDDESTALAMLKEGAQDYLLKSHLDGRSLLRAIRYAKERTRLKETRRRLAHADRLAAIGKVAAGVAHEVNNPAMFLSGNSHFIAEYAEELCVFCENLTAIAASEPDPERRAQLVGLLTTFNVRTRLDDIVSMSKINLKGIGRIATIVKDLQTFSRLDTPDVEWVKLDDVVDFACSVTNSAIRHCAELRKDVEPTAKIAGHRARLGQVLINLLLNAAHAVEQANNDNNTITVSTRQLNGMLLLAVEDTGIGVSDKDRQHIFEAFYTTKPAGKSTGLGLSLCSEVVAAHGGTITYENNAGSGARFEVRLPMDTGLVPIPPKKAKPAVPSVRGRVLVIDDEPYLLDAFERMLVKHHAVVLASSGEEALAILDKDQDFSTIICDLMMPKLDGVGVLSALHERHPELTPLVVFCTGGAVTGRTQNFLATVPNKVLRKPVTVDEVRALVAKMSSTAKTTVRVE